MRRTVTAAPAHVRPRVLVGRGRAVAERDGAAQKAPAEGAGGGGGEGGGVQGTRAGWAAALVAVERLVLEAHAAQRDVARGDALRDRRAHQLALAAVGVEVVDGAIALHLSGRAESLSSRRSILSICWPRARGATRRTQLSPAFRSQPATGLAQFTHVFWPGASAHEPSSMYERTAPTRGPDRVSGRWSAHLRVWGSSLQPGVLKHLLPSFGLRLKPTQPSSSGHAVMQSSTLAPTSSPSLPSGLR